MSAPVCRSLLLAALLLPTIPISAAELHLEDAERLALERDASLQRLQSLADAAHSRGIADGALPDPEIRLGYQNLPVDSFATDQEPMTQLRVGVQQRFPAGSSRQLQRERGAEQARVLQARRQQRALEIRRELREAWFDWRQAEASASLARRAREDFEKLVGLIDRRVDTGTARRRDLSQARLELATLAERVISLEADRDAAAAELARWLDEPVASVRKPGEAPDWPKPAAREQLLARLPEHPAIVAAQRQARVSAKEADIAREAYKPAWALSLAYGQRQRASAVGRDDLPDLLSGMVSLSVPLFTGNRQDRRLEAARHEENAARAERSDRLRQLAGQVERNLALWRRLDELAVFYDVELLDESQRLIESSEHAYRSNRASVDELIRARVDDIHHRLRALRIERDRAVARAELLYLEGK